MRHRLPPLLGGILLAALALMPAARAADQVHAAKAAGVAWTFTLLDVGIEQGIFAKYGLDVDTADMAGDARLQQALVSGAVDFGLGSGPSMALAAKGGQAIAVAAFAGEPRNIAIIVGRGQPDQNRRRSQRQEDGHDHQGLAHRMAGAAARRASKAGAMTAFR